MNPIIPNVYRLPGLTIGNVYCIIDPDGITLIDTSIMPSGPKILRHIKALGYPLSAVKRILITHAHPDHVGSLPLLKRETGAEVIASALERPVIEGRIPIPTLPPDKRRGLARIIVLPTTTLPPTPVDRVVADGDILEVLGGLRVVATPGHAPGHLAFWQPERRIMFCGDVIFRLPNIRLPFSFLTVDMDENKRAIRRIADLNAAIMCFGHGPPLHNAAARIQEFARKVGV